MKVLVGSNSGFCFGVKRAIDKAYELKEKGNVITLGPIIHNQIVVQKLEKDGIKSMEDAKEISNFINSYVIVRTHGAKKGVKEGIESKGFKVVDATCPFVLRSHRLVERMIKENFFVIIFGNPEHPEVKSVVSYAPENMVRVIKSKEEIDNLPYMKKVALISQTTQGIWDFQDVVKKLVEKVFDLRVFNTVCEVTLDAQKEAQEIAKISNIVIVIGGKMSSNTEKLYKVCKTVNNNTIKVEDSNDFEIDSSVFSNVKTVGITAGTSTSDTIIKEVIEKLRKISKNDLEIVIYGRKNQYSEENAFDSF